MQNFINLLLFILLLSCNSKSAHDNTATIKDISNNPVDNSAKSFTRDTIWMNNIGLVEIKKDDRFLGLLTFSGDSVIKGKDYYFKVTYLDINDDGYKDIRIFVFSRTPNQVENYLYDKETKHFRIVENSDLDIKKIEGTQVYFSYNSIGCGDDYWESHLSMIQDFKEINIGRIDARNCGEKSDGIRIYKVRGGKEILTQTLPISKIKRGENRWNFIENYWIHNHKIFEL